MSEDFRPEDCERMERFFDHLMSEEEADQFVADNQQDDSFRSEWSLQENIDASLKDLFAFGNPEVDSTRTKNSVEGSGFVVARKPSTSRWVRLALVASLLGVVCWGVWQWAVSGSAVVFQQASLAMIYDDTVQSGFKPYYECHDMQRFADTFEHRQGVALTLAEMPSDRRMLGLSYLGGVSRDATTMLCEVENLPVLVFVDMVSNDHADLMTTIAPRLNVFRVEKFGLVFYEISPLEQSSMIKFFALANPSESN